MRKIKEIIINNMAICYNFAADYRLFDRVAGKMTYFYLFKNKEKR